MPTCDRLVSSSLHDELFIHPLLVQACRCCSPPRVVCIMSLNFENQYARSSLFILKIELVILSYLFFPAPVGLYLLLRAIAHDVNVERAHLFLRVVFCGTLSFTRPSCSSSLKGAKNLFSSDSESVPKGCDKIKILL